MARVYNYEIRIYTRKYIPGIVGRKEYGATNVKQKGLVDCHVSGSHHQGARDVRVRARTVSLNPRGTQESKFISFITDGAGREFSDISVARRGA